jgi:hypothetical protein
MNTGDSCLITPYVPHSFTSRDGSKYAAIVAVTFSGRARDVLVDMCHVDSTKCLEDAGDMRNAAETRKKRIRRYAGLRGVTFTDKLSALTNIKLGELLTVSPSTFESNILIIEQEVAYSGRSSRLMAEPSSPWKCALAAAMHIPDAGGYDWHFDRPDTFESVGFYSYVYNYGDASVKIDTCVVNVGDSVVIKPYTRMECVPIISGSIVSLVVVYVGGWLSKPLLDELSTFAIEGRRRLTSNSGKWWSTHHDR